MNPGDTLRLEREGGYSLEGYELRMDASGTPRVVPKGEAQTENTTSGTWGTGFGLPNGVDDTVNALAVYNNSLFLGNNFTRVNEGDNPIPSSSIAQWTAITQEPAGTLPKGYVVSREE